MAVEILTHAHTVIDDDRHFLIDPDTKRITAQHRNLVLAQRSKNSEVLTFEIPSRTVEGHDMTKCNQVAIHYRNIEQETHRESIGIYTVKDLAAVDGDIVTLSWLIDEYVTCYAGGLVFSIHFACVEDGKVVYNFPTLTYSELTVGATIWNSETIAYEYPDIIANHEARISALESGSGGGSGGNVDYVGVEPAEDDIPKVFFGGALQQTKDEKVVPFRYISKTKDISGYAKIKAQGNSSMGNPKKNQTVKMFKDAECAEKLEVDFKGWGKQNKHCYKANWIDITHARNVVSARIWGDVVKSRANYLELPELLRTSPNHGAVDGFPVKVYADGVYQGRYSLNIPKDKWMANMDDELDEHCILCGEEYNAGCFRSVDATAWSDEVHDSMPTVIKDRWNEVISFVMNSSDEEFKSNLGDYFYVDSLIDYHLVGLASCDLDGYGKNQIYMTYDGRKWIASAYDKDSTWGLYFTGATTGPDFPRESYEDMKREGNLLYMRLEQLFYEEMQSRWAELKKSALSIENIINRFERFTDIAPAELVAEDYASTTGGGKFTGIPSKDTNNIQQIRSFALARQAWTDEYVAGLTPVVPVPCTGISLDVTELTFTEAGNKTITATVTPEGCTDKIIWTTDSESVVMVTNGVVTAIGNGNATITATCGGYSASCAISVSGIAVPIEPVELPEGYVYTLESREFDGVDDYVDTNVQLLGDTSKDFGIYIDFTPDANVTNNANANVFNCQYEGSGYRGIALASYFGSTGNLAINLNTGREFLPVAKGSTSRYRLAISHNRANGEIKYTFSENGLVVKTNTVSMNFPELSQNLLIGCYQTPDGNTGRYGKFALHQFAVWFNQLTDEQMTALVTE